MPRSNKNARRRPYEGRRVRMPRVEGMSVPAAERPVNSRDVASKAAKRISELDLSRQVRLLALQVAKTWGIADTAKKANQFWQSAESLKYLFYRDTYSRGLSTLGYSAVIAFKNSQRFDRFSPEPQEAAKLTAATLESVAGGLEILTLLDSPVPLGLGVTRRVSSNDYGWGREVTEPLTTRLTAYDPTTISRLGNRG